MELLLVLSSVPAAGVLQPVASVDAALTLQKGTTEPAGEDSDRYEFHRLHPAGGCIRRCSFGFLRTRSGVLAETPPLRIARPATLRRLDSMKVASI